MEDLRANIYDLVENQYEDGFRIRLDIDTLTDKIIATVEKFLDSHPDFVYNESKKGGIFNATD